MKSAEQWIEELFLEPHPEGGYFRESYRSPMMLEREAIGDCFQGERSVSTAIYYLLKAGQRSKLHRIASDEMWHHYAGGNLRIFVLSPEGETAVLRLGTEGEGARPQQVVPAGYWFGAAPEDGVEYTLAGCTVAPGFDFKDFEMAEPESIARDYPGLSGQLREWL